MKFTQGMSLIATSDAMATSSVTETPTTLLSDRRLKFTPPTPETCQAALPIVAKTRECWRCEASCPNTKGHYVTCKQLCGEVQQDSDEALLLNLSLSGVPTSGDNNVMKNSIYVKTIETVLKEHDDYKKQDGTIEITAKGLYRYYHDKMTDLKQYSKDSPDNLTDDDKYRHCRINQQSEYTDMYEAYRSSDRLDRSSNSFFNNSMKFIDDVKTHFPCFILEAEIALVHRFVRTSWRTMMNGCFSFSTREPHPRDYKECTETYLGDQSVVSEKSKFLELAYTFMYGDLEEIQALVENARFFYEALDKAWDVIFDENPYHADYMAARARITKHAEQVGITNQRGQTIIMASLNLRAHNAPESADYRRYIKTAIDNKNTILDVFNTVKDRLEDAIKFYLNSHDITFVCTLGNTEDYNCFWE